MPRSPEQTAHTLHRAGIYFSAVHQFGDELTTKEIGLRIGMPKPTLERWNQALNFKKKPVNKGFPSKLSGREEEFRRLDANLSNKALAKRFGVTFSCVQKWRGKLGLKDKHGGVWQRSKHPRGMAGKKHTEKLKRAMSRRSKRLWADPNSVFHSAAFKMLRRKRGIELSKRRPIGWMGPNSYSRCKRGRRKDLGNIYFRSRWEANMARFFKDLVKNGTLKSWEFEPDTFWFEKIRRGCRSYTPDFKITWPDGRTEYWEIKGWMDPKSKTKLKRMKKYYPDVKIVLCDAKAYRHLSKSCEDLPHWEFEK